KSASTPPWCSDSRNCCLLTTTVVSIDVTTSHLPAACWGSCVQVLPSRWCSSSVSRCSCGEVGGWLWCRPYHPRRCLVAGVCGWGGVDVDGKRRVRLSQVVRQRNPPVRLAGTHERVRHRRMDEWHGGAPVARARDRTHVGVAAVRLLRGSDPCARGTWDDARW